LLYELKLFADVRFAKTRAENRPSAHPNKPAPQPSHRTTAKTLLEYQNESLHKV
jgi:hypothetical protein